MPVSTKSVPAPEPKPEAAATEPTPEVIAEETRSGAIALDYDCGYCGKAIGKEGQHVNEGGEQVETPHAGTMVLARPGK